MSSTYRQLTSNVTSYFPTPFNPAFSAPFTAVPPPSVKFITHTTNKNLIQKSGQPFDSTIATNPRQQRRERAAARHVTIKQESALTGNAAPIRKRKAEFASPSVEEKGPKKRRPAEVADAAYGTTWFPHYPNIASAAHQQPHLAHLNRLENISCLPTMKGRTSYSKVATITIAGLVYPMPVVACDTIYIPSPTLEEKVQFSSKKSGISSQALDESLFGSDNES